MITLLLGLALILAPLLQATVWYGFPCDLTLVLTLTAGMLGGPLWGLGGGLLGGLMVGTVIGNLAAAMAIVYGALGILAGTARWDGARTLPRAALTAAALGCAWLAFAWLLMRDGDGPRLDPQAVLLAIASQTTLVMVLTAILARPAQRRPGPTW